MQQTPQADLKQLLERLRGQAPQGTHAPRRRAGDVATPPPAMSATSASLHAIASGKPHAETVPSPAAPAATSPLPASPHAPAPATAAAGAAPAPATEKTEQTQETEEAQEAAAKVHALLALMSAPDSEVGAQEKRLIHDLVAWYLPHLPRDAQAEVVERAVCMVPGSATLLTAIIALQDEEFLCRLAQRAHMPHDMLIELAERLPPPLLHHFLQRSILPQALLHVLCRRMPDHRLADLLEREDIMLGDGDWRLLCRRAFAVCDLCAAILKRADVPNAIAAELFWPAPAELRRTVPRRLATQGIVLIDIMELAPMPPCADVNTLVQRLLAGDAQQAAAMCGLAEASMRRILADAAHGEAMIVLLRAAGMGYLQAREQLPELAEAGLLPAARIGELADLLGTMGRQQAQALLLYWDWRSRRIGPYADFPALEISAAMP